MAVQFSDNHLGFIAMLMRRADPMGIIAEAQDILARINEYAQAKQQEQVAVAAEVDTADE